MLPALGRTALQRQCACGQHTPGGGECAGCRAKREQKLQRTATGSDSSQVAPSIVHEVLRSPGQPLDRSTRAFMEPRFGHDFSRVRVHTNAKAAESAQAVGALAYTVGQDIVFRSGQFDPTTEEGKRVLAHELTHTVQQRNVSPGMQTKLEISRQSDPSEQEAESVADSIATGSPITIGHSSSANVARQEDRDGGTTNDASAETTNDSPQDAGLPGGVSTPPAPAAPASAGSAPPPGSLCQVDVRAAPAAFVGWAGFWHLFIVTTDGSRVQKFFRGGTRQKCGATSWPFYGISTNTGPYAPGTIDWNPGAPSVTLVSGPSACGHEGCFSSELTRIAAGCTPYKPLGPNSNTVVKTLLLNCGLPLNKPVSNTPGWGDPPL